MPPPSALAIKTSSLQRLVKEEASYHKELSQQQARIEKFEDQIRNGTLGEEDEAEKGNREFMLGQEKRALSETLKVFPTLQTRILSNIEALESQLESSGPETSEAEIQKAKDVLDEAKKSAATASVNGSTTA